jgi:hypothetical protein
LHDDDLCDCGQPSASGDFLCMECRAQLEKERCEAQGAGADQGLGTRSKGEE